MNMLFLEISKLKEYSTDHEFNLSHFVVVHSNKKVWTNSFSIKLVTLPAYTIFNLRLGGKQINNMIFNKFLGMIW